MPVITPDYYRYRPAYAVKRPQGTPQDPQPDDLASWPSSETFATMPLPGVAGGDPYFLVFEVTRKLQAAAIADTYGLRFTGTNGVHLAHMRTATNRIFVGGTFPPAAPITLTAYWGKTGQTQPGNGFPASSTLMAPFRAFVLFENGAANDFSPFLASFTIVGSPTFPAGINGQAMQCGPGNHIQTTAAKLRGDARSARHAMALIYTPQTDAAARTICWANWTNDQRGFQLWGDTSYVELYIDDDGVLPFQKWVNRTPFTSGWSWIGGYWTSYAGSAVVQRDQEVLVVSKEYGDGEAQGQIYNSTSPYIIGGTPVTGSYHAGMVESVLELDTDSENTVMFGITPTGASATTAGYDNLPPGVASSIAMADMDATKNAVFASRFVIAGRKHGVSPALLAAISSRETRAGSGLDENGLSDGGFGVGLMSIDNRYFTPVSIGPDFASQGHIDQATSILMDFVAQAAAAHPEWSESVRFQAGVAAYNGGSDVFADGPVNFDLTTDGGDYSNDVIARAQYYAEAMTAFYNPVIDQMKAFDLSWRTNEQFLGIDRTPDAFDPPDLINQELGVEVLFPKIMISGISPGTTISISGGIAPTFSISSSLTSGDDVRTKSAAAGVISSGQFVRIWDTTSGLYSSTVRTDLTIGTSKFVFTSTTKPSPGTGGGSGIPEGAATYTVNSLSQLQSVINNQLSPGQIVEITAGDYRDQGTLTVSGKDWSGGAKAVIRASTHAYRGPHPSQGGLFVSGESAFTAGSGGAEFSAINLINSKNFVLEGIRLYVGQGYEANWNQFITSISNSVIRNCRFAGYKPSGYPNGWVVGAPGYTWDVERVPQGFAIKEATGCLFQNCLFQYVKRGVWIIGGNSTYEGCVWTDTAGDLVYMSHTNSGQQFIKCVIFRTFPPSTSFHCDSLQCTAKDANASANQLYELCLIGPGNSGYPHVQGPFLEEDNAAFLGPENVIFKDTLIENRTANALYLRPARVCQAQNVTVIQNQFGGIDTSHRDTLIHAPIINFNASGTSRGGNIVNRSVYFSLGLGGSDTSTNNYQLLGADYATHLYDYPLYSAGLWRPCMFLDGFCKVDVAELQRMAPKVTAPFHPTTADIGAHRLFTHYGALP